MIFVLLTDLSKPPQHKPPFDRQAGHKSLLDRIVWSGEAVHEIGKTGRCLLKHASLLDKSFSGRVLIGAMPPLNAIIPAVPTDKTETQVQIRSAGRAQLTSQQVTFCHSELADWRSATGSFRNSRHFLTPRLDANHFSTRDTLRMKSGAQAAASSTQVTCRLRSRTHVSYRQIDPCPESADWRRTTGHCLVGTHYFSTTWQNAIHFLTG